MIKALFNDKSSIDLKEISNDGLSGLVNGNSYSWDVLRTSENSWSVIDKKGESFIVVLESINADSKKISLKINNQPIEVTEQSEFDLLLMELGISSGGSKKLKEIKAPMPGLVIDVIVEEGNDVVEGDVVLILEAMKMENVIKVTAPARVKSIKVKKGDTIEKGAVMITFE